MKVNLCRACRFYQRLTFYPHRLKACHYSLMTGRTATAQIRDDPSLTHSSTDCSFYERDPRKMAPRPDEPATVVDRLPHDKILRMYNEGMNDKEIGKAAGVNPYHVFEWRKRYDLPAQLKKGISEAKIMEGYQKGLTDAKLAAFAGCSQTKVYNWRTANELPPNSTRGVRRK